MRGPVVASVREEATLREVAEELVIDEIGAVLVQGPHGPTGVISERDLVTVFGTGGDLDQRQAADVMNSEMLWASPDDTIGEVAARMSEAGIRHLPVRDRNGKVVGLVSSRDLLTALVDEAEAE